MLDKYIFLKILIICDSVFHILAFGCSQPYIKNGNFQLTMEISNLSTRIHVDAIVQFHCQSNYTIIGSSYSLCRNGQWSHRFPTCENKPECLAPKILKGWVECLTMDCDRFFVGSEAAIRCERGYRLMGTSRLHCKFQYQKKPTWSAPVPKCVLIDLTDYSNVDQDRQSYNLFYTENSSIMIIIIILSVLAGGLMLVMSIMLINRLFYRRWLLRIQRSENAFNQPAVPEISSIDVNRNDSRHPVVEEIVRERPTRWNCFRTFTSRNSHYQNMDTQTTEPIPNFEQDYNPVDNLETYNSIYSDDQTSLIQPPCYEEAVKCSQYSIVASKNSLDQQKLKNSYCKPKSIICARSIDKEVRQNSPRQVNSTLCSAESENINQSIVSIPNTSMQSNFTTFQSQNNNKHHSQNNVATRSNDMDNISRRSARVHCPRVTNNITSESNVSFRSGSIDTMTISDGTSVTVHTLDSHGSNPSLGSMRPQTGSIGDPTTCVNNCPVQYRNQLVGERSGTPFTEIDFTTTDARYSPPPSYECSLNNPVIIKTSRNYHSNTTSPSTNSNVALFVDNMACIDDSNAPS